MKSLILALNSGHDILMGYAFNTKIKGKNFRSEYLPVFKTSNNLLVGLTGSKQSLLELKTTPIIINKENNLINNIQNLRSSLPKLKKNTEILILTSNNYVFRYAKNVIDVFEEEAYIAIGKGSEVALGALYGLDSSRYSIVEKLEVALKITTKFYPDYTETGYIKL